MNLVNRTRLLMLSSAAILIMTALPAMAAGDAEKGADVFAENCADCHSMTPGKNKKGPSLSGIVNRNSASVTGFSNYSQALRDSGIVWTVDKLDAYIADPGKAVPGGKMKFDGLDNAGDRADLLAYLSGSR